MSRTDKHTPYWVTVDLYEPVHTHFSHPCDLPVEPVRANPTHRPRYPTEGWNSCFWTPRYPTYRHERFRYSRPVPTWYVDHVWNNAERVRSRDGLRGLAREYNTYGELEDGDFASWQHRHGATWYWD